MGASVTRDTDRNSGSFDQQRAQLFAERVHGVLNGGALALMISVGHRTGLFDKMAELGPATSVEIASSASLNERYVREWLAAMTTGQILIYEPDRRRYFLPPEHAMSLTRAARPGNLAVSAQWLPVLASVEDRIVKCFRSGGGVPYSGYARVEQVTTEEIDQTTLDRLVDAIVPLVQGLPDRLRAGIDVLALGGGRAQVTNILARAFPNSRFTSHEMQARPSEAARRVNRRFPLDNARFPIVAATPVEAEEAFDLVMSFNDVLHDHADPGAVLRRIHQSLRPGGTLLMQDIAASSELSDNLHHPLGPFLYTVSCLHCMSVSLAADGIGLGAMWGEQQARALLATVGFKTIRTHRLPDDVQNSYFTARKI